MARTILLGLFLVWWLGDSAFADRLIFTNGDRLSGRLTKADASGLLFQPSLEGARPIQAVWREVSLLEVTSPITLELEGGEKLVEMKAEAKAVGVTVSSRSLGRFTFPWPRITSLHSSLPSLQFDSSLPFGEADRIAVLDDSRLAAIQGAGSGAPAAADPDPNADNGANGDVPKIADSVKEEDIRQVFLRQSAVLLQPGEWESEVSVSYTHDESSTVENLARSGLEGEELRFFETRFSMRMSPIKRVEAFVSVPLIAAEEKLTTDLGRVLRQHANGFGDLSGGFKYQLVSENAHWPDVIASLSFVAPTGPNPYGLATTTAPVGSGHWGLLAGVEAIKTMDPAVIFGGIEYEYRFARDTAEGAIRPGGLVDYNLGVGLSINDELSLSGELLGTFTTGGSSAPAGVLLDNAETVSLRAALTYRATPRCHIEAAVTFGLNDAAPDSTLSLSIFNRF